MAAESEGWDVKLVNVEERSQIKVKDFHISHTISFC